MKTATPASAPSSCVYVAGPRSAEVEISLKLFFWHAFFVCIFAVKWLFHGTL